MRTLILVIVTFALVAPIAAQPVDFFAAGPVLNPEGTVRPAFAYAHRLNAAGTLYSFSEYTVTSFSRTPKISLQVDTLTGVATPIRSYGRVTIWGAGDAGLSRTDSATGFSYSLGGFAHIPIGRGFGIVVPFKTVKSTLSDFQFQTGVFVGWGK